MTNTHSPQPNKGRYLAYLRVSTPKQGEGVSLLTQREMIATFAARKHLLVTGWYEEKETAAKRGRPVFRQILSLLRSRQADGLIVYKVDRSARNLKDWAELGELIDQGIPVYFASDDLDTSSRGGRLAADIQAVVAADFIRNLREEAKRGIRKRLEQGLRPNGAPVGYLDRGKGKPKDIDPEKGPLVRLAFAWYATGDYTLRKLASLLSDLGRRGARMGLSGVAYLLRNPFYIGYLEVRANRELLPGIHEPLGQPRALLRGAVTPQDPHLAATSEAPVQVQPDAEVCDVWQKSRGIARERPGVLSVHDGDVSDGECEGGSGGGLSHVLLLS